MHTLRITMMGLVLLSVFLFVAAQINARKGKGTVNGAYWFVWVWLGVSLVNFYVGVFVANYSIGTEIAVHAIVFGVPALAAWYLSRWFASKA